MNSICEGENKIWYKWGPRQVLEHMPKTKNHGIWDFLSLVKLKDEIEYWIAYLNAYIYSQNASHEI